VLDEAGTIDDSSIDCDPDRPPDEVSSSTGSCDDLAAARAWRSRLAIPSLDSLPGASIARGPNLAIDAARTS